jgi:ABC-type phosphate transport system substrate-binding protein
MKRAIERYAWAAALLACLAGPAAAADLVVIANPSVSASDISADDLKLIFLGSKTSFGGSNVEPVLADAGAAHEEFLKSYLSKSDSALRNHFKSLVFTGKGSMPKSFNSDAAIVAYIAKTKGAIGYVAEGAAGSAKKLAVK